MTNLKASLLPFVSVKYVFLHSYVIFAYTDPILSIGCRCCRSSRQAKNNLRIPDTFDTSTAGNDRACRACDGGVHSFCTCTGGSCYSSEKSRVRERGQDGSVDSITICIIVFGRFPICFFLDPSKMIVRAPTTLVFLRLPDASLQCSETAFVFS